MGIMNHKSPSSRYPAVGDNYKKREAKYGTGEWEGYIYDPFIDKYRPDPKVQKEYYEKEGLVDKQEKPSLFEQLYPTVVGVGAYEIGKAAGPDIYTAGKGMLGLGDKAKPEVKTEVKTEPAANNTASSEVAAIDAANLSPNGQYVPDGYTETDASLSSTDPSLGTEGTSGTTTGGITAGQAAQGALGAYQAYQGYEQYKDGDEVGGALNMAVGANNASGNVLGNAGTYLTAALAAYNAAQALKDDNATGKEKAVAVNKAAGQAVGDFFTWGGLSAAKHAFGKEFGKFEGFVDDKLMKYDPVTRGLGSVLDGKNKGQMMRDKVRDFLKEGGLLDENYNVELADGSKFDLGRDGSVRLYEFDEAAKSDPYIQEQLKLVNPLAKILTGGDAELGGQFAGMFTNAIRSSGDPVANAKAMYAKAGITNWDQARAALQELKTAGKLTDQEVAVYDQGLANIFGGVPMSLPKPAPVVAGPAPVTATPEQATSALGSLSGVTPTATTPITQGPALGGLMSLGRAEQPVVAVTPVARPTFTQPVVAQVSPFSGGLMSLQRPQQEQEMVVVPVARGGYR